MLNKFRRWLSWRKINVKGCLKKTKKLNICRDCKHYEDGFCAKIPSMVTGKPAHNCWWHRKDYGLWAYFNGSCGEVGRWFEEKTDA